MILTVGQICHNELQGLSFQSHQIFWDMMTTLNESYLAHLK